MLLFGSLLLVGTIFDIRSGTSVAVKSDCGKTKVDFASCDKALKAGDKRQAWFFDTERHSCRPFVVCKGESEFETKSLCELDCKHLYRESLPQLLLSHVIIVFARVATLSRQKNGNTISSMLSAADKSDCIGEPIAPKESCPGMKQGEFKCADIICPDGYECKSGSTRALCCESTKEGVCLPHHPPPPPLPPPPPPGPL